MGLVVRISKGIMQKRFGACVVEALLAHTSLLEGCFVERLCWAWLCEFPKISCTPCIGAWVVEALLAQTFFARWVEKLYGQVAVKSRCGGGTWIAEAWRLRPVWKAGAGGMDR